MDYFYKNVFKQNQILYKKLFSYQVVISIRGTLSMKDVMTDLNAEGEVLPLTPPREDWLGHKGMVQAAEYIRRKLNEEGIISKAFSWVRFSKCLNILLSLTDELII